MFRRITAACSTVVLLALSCAMAQAAPTPSSGTLSPLTPALAFADGPFTGANPSNQVPGSVGPDCGAVSNTCSDYALTVSIPPGYTALHPNDVVTIKVQWPTATVNDFDVYILDPSGTSVAHPGSATSADPEIASFHIADGTTSYKVRIGVFQAANESYTATVTLGPASQNVPILAHSYSLGTDVWTCNKHLDATNPTGPPPAVDHNLDGEPLTAFDGNGRLYISALAGVPVGCGVWYTDDACAQATTFVGAPDDGVGGGDAEIRTAPEKNPLGHYNVYTSSLSLANITTAVSFDGGNTFVATPLSSYTPVVDRNWNATYGSSICYLSFVNGATQPGNLLEVVRMDYTGMAAPVIAPASVVWDPLSVDPNQPHQKGNIVVDQRPGANTALLTAGPNGQGNVYTCWNESGQRVYCSVSTNFATTWTHHLVWDGGVGASYDHIFTWMAVDKAGNLYIVFSDDRNVYLCTSTDKGVTWTTPVRVNRGAGASNSCIFPQVVAGSVGHIAVCFYGASTTSPADPASNWQVYIARSDNALLQQPDFVEVKVNDDDFHTGAVCEAGFNCSSGRELCDNFDLDVNPVDGGLALAYGVFGVSGTFIARQLSGAGLFTDKTLADRSAGCPNPVNGCTVQAITGSPCIAPGFVTVVADPPGSTDLPPVAQPSEDILSVGVGEPDGVGNALEFSIKVASLDPANLPPNTFWRAIWVGPGGQRYVDVVNCATGGLSSHYGHFTTGSGEGGASGGFTLGADGHIRIRIAKSKVDNPAPGTTLTAVNADCRTIAGTCPVQGSAAFAPNDVTNSGQYVVVGNGFCTPLTVNCPTNVVAHPGTQSLDFTVTNPGTGTHAIAGTVTDTHGWISAVGVLAGPLGPGATGTLTATLNVPGNCGPPADDSLTFHVTAADLPNAPECNTAVHCATTAGVDQAAPHELSLAISGANPCRGGTTLAYTLPRQEVVRLEVYSAGGRRVRTLFAGQLAAGRYSARFTIGGDTKLGAGVYFVALSAGGEKRTVAVTALQ